MIQWSKKRQDNKSLKELKIEDKCKGKYAISSRDKWQITLKKQESSIMGRSRSYNKEEENQCSLENMLLMTEKMLMINA